MPDATLAPLPGARREGSRIGQLLRRSPLEGRAAGEASFKRLAPVADLLHLATHGQFVEERPLDSWIALAPEGKEDGFLRAAEIFTLDLKARMVVLSACQSGQGRITGDGVLGLSRSFIGAGVPTVLVTQWSVEDEATAYEMEAFYRAVARGIRPAAALRQAMLQTKKKYPAVRSWAAFTLIGEG